MLLALISACAPLPSSLKNRINLRQFSTCGDFLERWGKKPPELQFSGCKKEKNPQFDRLVASYTVKGTDAATVETFLQQKFKMASLEFMCCGWQPLLPENQRGDRSAQGSYTDALGNYFNITLYSDETLVKQRKDWSKIEKFNLRISKYLGTP